MSPLGHVSGTAGTNSITTGMFLTLYLRRDSVFNHPGPGLHAPYLEGQSEGESGIMMWPHVADCHPHRTRETAAAAEQATRRREK